MKFEVRKHITIEAPVDTVRELIEDFNNWSAWSPWTVLEPTCAISIEGTPNQTGHLMSWDGEIIGSGKNTLCSSDGNQLNYNLEFYKPFKSKAKVSFRLEEKGAQTEVSWTMASSMPFFLFFMIKTMKNMIGMDYERGLRMLKEIAEKGRINCTTVNNGVIEYQGFTYVGIERTVPIVDMPKSMDKDFQKIVDDIVVDRQKGALHWICIYPKFDLKAMEATYIAAVSDEDLSDADLDTSYVKGKIESSRMLEIKHDGAYEFLGNAWSMGMMYMRAKKVKGSDFPFEQYWNNPMETAPEDLKTSIYFPVK